MVIKGEMKQEYKKDITTYLIISDIDIIVIRHGFTFYFVCSKNK